MQQQPGTTRTIVRTDGMASAGDTVAGVHLNAQVGRGASGTVWIGRDQVSGDRVAVKLLDDPLPAAAEARLLAGVHHPHVVHLRRLSSTPPALVLDLAEGGSVASLVRARGLLDPGEIVTALAPIAGALAAVHATGVVHGDVTAANILLTADGRPLLADLGSARLLGVGSVVATPGYAAPEVLAGAPPGPAADLHGLAAVGWFALTGSAPGVAADRPPLVLLAPECPQALLDILTAGVSADPVRRPSLPEFAAALHAAVRPRAVRLVAGAMPAMHPADAVTHRIRSEALASQPGDPGGPSSRRRVRPGTRRLRSLVGVAVGALTLAGLVVALGAVGGWERSPATSAATPLPTAAVGAAAPAPAVQPQQPETAESAIPRLVRARQGALNAGDPAALSAVHAPGSPSLAADTALLTAGPLQVGFEVVDTRGVSTGTETDQRRTVEVELLTRLGTADPVVERVRVTLVSIEGSWLIEGVGPPA